MLMAKTCCLGIKDPYEEGNWFDDLSFDTPPPPPEREGEARQKQTPNTSRASLEGPSALRFDRQKCEEQGLHKETRTSVENGEK